MVMYKTETTYIIKEGRWKVTKKEEVQGKQLEARSLFFFFFKKPPIRKKKN